jgi:hypothetical protein
MNFISIGGWCGTKIALKDLGLFDEPSLPFDSVRSSIEGIIDCIETDFAHFFPEEIQNDTVVPTAFIGRYIGFYHHNLLETRVLESFARQITRFDEKIKKGNCVFLRSIVTDNYDEELMQYKKLQAVLDKKYPSISYIICFIIPNQPQSQYYKHLDDRTFIFTVNDNSHNNDNLTNEYQPIYDFIAKEDLFHHIPPQNDIEISAEKTRRLWIIEGQPMVHHCE